MPILSSFLIGHVCCKDIVGSIISFVMKIAILSMNIRYNFASKVKCL